MKELKKLLAPAIILLFGILAIVFGVLAIKCRGGTFGKHQGAWTALLVFAVTALCAGAFVFYTMKKIRAYKLLLLLLGSVVLGLVFGFTYIKLQQSVNFTSVEELRAFVSAKGGGAVWAFIAVQFAQVTLIPIPSTITTGVGYALFGLWEGTLYAFIGSLLGSVLAFGIGRIFGYQAVKWLVGKETLDAWLGKIKGKDKLLLTFMFIMPFFPDDILCMVAGLSTMSTTFFLVMITPVRLITIFVTCLTLGGNLIPFHSWGIAVWAAILFAVIVCAYILWKKGTKMQEVLLGWLKKGKRK